MGIRRAYSASTDARIAAREFHREVFQPEMDLVIFFCSSDYDLDTLGEEIHSLFAGVVVTGCTSAGEIGPGGYKERGISGVSFSREVCAAVTGSLGRLRQFQMLDGQTLIKDLLDCIREKEQSAKEKNTVALLLIDGLCLREEQVTRTLQDALGKIPLAGGSAGDGMRFQKTFVYANGSFRSDCAQVVLINTPLPFTVFKTQHFVSTEQRLVITEAYTSTRMVKEINGLPAATEYARVLGVSERDLTPARFAASPVVVLIDGNNYVRSIQKANPDGSINLYCAIDEGIVLRVARGVDIVDNLEGALSRLEAQLGAPQLVIACDCVLRRIEIVQAGLEERIGNILNAHNAVGFNTYGEQFHGVHINQTLSGIAFGASPSEVCDAG